MHWVLILCFLNLLTYLAICAKFGFEPNWRPNEFKAKKKIIIAIQCLNWRPNGDNNQFNGFLKESVQCSMPYIYLMLNLFFFQTIYD
jgi:hypothetical protein